MAIITVKYWIKQADGYDVSEDYEATGVVLGWVAVDSKVHAVILPLGEDEPTNLPLSEITVVRDMRNKDFRKMMKHLAEHDDD